MTLNPATPLFSIQEILRDVDLALIMSVNPGFGGQMFIPSRLRKITEVRTQLDRLKSHALLEVDGGTTVDHAQKIVAAGVIIQPNYAATVKE